MTYKIIFTYSERTGETKMKMSKGTTFDDIKVHNLETAKDMLKDLLETIAFGRDDEETNLEIILQDINKFFN